MKDTCAERGEGPVYFQAPEELAGYDVRDPLGQKVGTVERVFLNAAGEPEYIRTRVGFLGTKRVLLPVQLVAVDDERHEILLR